MNRRICYQIPLSLVISTNVASPVSHLTNAKHIKLFDIIWRAISCGRGTKRCIVWKTDIFLILWYEFSKRIPMSSELYVGEDKVSGFDRIVTIVLNWWRELFACVNPVTWSKIHLDGWSRIKSLVKHSSLPKRLHNTCLGSTRRCSPVSSASSTGTRDWIVIVWTSRKHLIKLVNRAFVSPSDLDLKDFYLEVSIVLNKNIKTLANQSDVMIWSCQLVLASGDIIQGLHMIARLKRSLVTILSFWNY